MLLYRQSIRKSDGWGKSLARQCYRRSPARLPKFSETSEVCSCSQIAPVPSDFRLLSYSYTPAST